MSHVLQDLPWPTVVALAVIAMAIAMAVLWALLAIAVPFGLKWLFERFRK